PLPARTDPGRSFRNGRLSASARLIPLARGKHHRIVQMKDNWITVYDHGFYYDNNTYGTPAPSGSYRIRNDPGDGHQARLCGGPSRHLFLHYFLQPEKQPALRKAGP